MKNNSFIKKFKEKDELIDKRGISNLINNINSNRNDNIIKPKKIENLILKLKNKKNNKNNKDFLYNQHYTQEFNKGKNYNPKLPFISLSGNTSKIMKNSNSNKIIKSNKKLNNNNKQDKNIIIIENNDINNRKIKFNKNNKISKDKNYYSINKYERNPSKTFKLLNKNRNIYNNILTPEQKRFLKNNQFKIIEKLNRNNYNYKKEIGKREKFQSKNKIIFPSIITTPESKITKKINLNKNSKLNNSFKRKNSYTPILQNHSKINKNFQKINKIYQSKKRPQSLNHSLLKNLNYNIGKKHNTFENISNNNKLFKRNILKINYSNSSQSNIIKKYNKRKTNHSNQNDLLENIKNNFKKNYLNNEIKKSNSFMNINHQIENNGNLSKNKNFINEKYNNRNKILNLKNNNLFRNNNKINKNHNINFYDNNIYFMKNKINNYNNIDNIINHNIKSITIKNNSSQKSKNIRTIKDYIKNYDINEKSNYLIEKYKQYSEQTKRFNTSFEDKNQIFLPSIPHNLNLINEEINHNYNREAFNNIPIEENNQNILEILMNQRLLYQNNLPENSRFKLKTLA